ncbi:hypothetical protein CISIN_1g034352mg [Citrus sinensis]|uniref:Uncharacterized protein n=1 Tax=Citrus sinensis TaxID=2711 RepID=A0A067DJX8_CITSI|nr:hypothetical protein CISIN_1g034352mg [Citrus sinensis]
MKKCTNNNKLSDELKKKKIKINQSPAVWPHKSSLCVVLSLIYSLYKYKARKKTKRITENIHNRLKKHAPRPSPNSCFATPFRNSFLAEKYRFPQQNK